MSAEPTMARTMSPNEISHEIIKAALKVHSALGPGLLESAYRGCLAHELRKAGFRVETEVLLPVVYDGVKMDFGYRIDVLVHDLVIVELKSVDENYTCSCGADTLLYEAQQEAIKPTY